MSPIMSPKRASVLLAIPVALTLALAGCGMAGGPGLNQDEMPGTASPTAETGGEFNDADATFVTTLIPHHEQAVEMSEEILAKDDIDDQVVALAEQIKDAYESDVELMEGWLEDWGIDDDAAEVDDDEADGMMSEDDLEALEAAEGSEAERLYLEGMIEHHEAAIELAEDELGEGINPDVLELAQATIDTQTAELAKMKDLVAES